MCSNWFMGSRAATAGVRRRESIGVAILILALVPSGCGRIPGADPPGHGTAPVGGPKLNLVDHDGLLAEIAARRGKVVVLDCWSSSCPPCVREFPGLVALQRSFPEEVACLSLCFDYDGIGDPEAMVPMVRDFLASVEAHSIVNLLSREEADSMYAKLGLVSVPAIYVWSPDGTLAHRFDDEDSAGRLGRPFTYADVQETVRGLLRP
jgi:thiol-disulfide isomerase/thioredoxin